MPKRNAVNLLPEDVRKELIERLINNHFSGYVGLSEWLKSLGHNISKSSLHRFGSEFELQRADESSEISASASVGINVRMRCIEAAVKSGASDVLVVSQSYLDWVNQG